MNLILPRYLVFENLHWIDAETQTFLDSLIESLPTGRMLLLVNYRPEYQHSWGSKTYYTQLRLDPLPCESAQELLGALLGDAEELAPLKQRLIDRTEGNPFFLEESVRTLVENQVLGGQRGAYRLAKALPSIQVPATVQAVLAARIDRLPPAEKRLLQCAAVIGTHVPFALLQAIAERPEEGLRRGLAHLQAAEFLYETCLFPDIEYTFKHALTYQVAYGNLLQEQRRALHARIVEAIQTLYPERLAKQVEQLAHHAFQGEVWDQALVYLQQAAAKAVERSANREAVAWLEGERLYERFGLPDLPAVLSRTFVVRCFAELGEFAAGVTGAEEAVRVAKVGNHPYSLSQAYLGSGLLYLRKGELLQAISVLERGLELCQGGNFSLLIPVAIAKLGYAHALSGRLTEALPLLEQAVEQAVAMRIMARHSLRMAWLSEAYLLAGRMADASQLAQRALALSYDQNERGYQAWTLRLLGEIDLHRDPPELEQAKGHFRHALALADELGMRPLVAHCHLGLGKVYLQAGRHDKALAASRAAIELYRDMDMTFWHPPAEAILAAVEGR